MSDDSIDDSIKAIDVVIWDSGHWGGGGFSQPRILSALRNFEMTGKLRIAEVRYVKTASQLSPRLTNEPKQAHEIREERRHDIQKSRVYRTTKLLRCTYHEESIEEDLKPITPDRKLLLIVILPPGEDRTRLISKLMRLEIKASLIILPAVWRNSEELESILALAKTLNNTKVRPTPFVPYRFSESMRVLKEKKEAGKEIEILSAEVISGKYPRWGRIGSTPFLSEFAGPVIDALLHAAGSPIETGSIIYKEAQGRLPCILVSAVHQNGVISHFKILAISNFQLVNLKGEAFFAGERFIFTDAFRDSIFYAGDGVIRSSEASRGHDAKIEDRNGYGELLSSIINNINNEVRDNEKLPTLDSFRNTQAFIDKISSLLTEMQKLQQKQKPFTL